LKILCGEQVYPVYPTLKNFLENSLEITRVAGSAYLPPSTYPARSIPDIQCVDVSLVSSVTGKPVMTADEQFMTMNV